MKVLKFLCVNFIIVCLLYSCFKDEKKTHTNVPVKDNYEIDTSKIGVLVLKKNKTFEDQLLMVKNAAFCSCIGKEEYKIQHENSNKYLPIPDQSFTGYMSNSNLGEEIFLKNLKLNKLIEKWSQKQYNVKGQEDENSKTYMIYMKCLDFYNSKELNDYINSLKVK